MMVGVVLLAIVVGICIFLYEMMKVNKERERNIKEMERKRKERRESSPFNNTGLVSRNRSNRFTNNIVESTEYHGNYAYSGSSKSRSSSSSYSDSSSGYSDSGSSSSDSGSCDSGSSSSSCD